jgi:hypothetical protein
MLSVCLNIPRISVSLKHEYPDVDTSMRERCADYSIGPFRSNSTSWPIGSITFPPLLPMLRRCGSGILSLKKETAVHEKNRNSLLLGVTD